MTSYFVFVLNFLVVGATHASIKFSRACETASHKVTVGAVGDFLMHKPLQVRGYRDGFDVLWKPVQYRINEVDIMYGNLETPTANGVKLNRKADGIHDPVFDNQTFTSYPQFNVHNQLIFDIAKSGFHILSTANNHTMDRGPLGADLTIESLKSAGIAFTGSRLKGSQESFTTYMYKNGLRLAFISCTFSLNGLPDPFDQALECYREKAQLMNEVRSASHHADAVIVTPHWGVEYVHTPTTQEIQLGKELLEAGALAVIGTHPHVVQPIQKHQTRDGREGLIVYSTGNFISSQPGIRKVGLMVFLGLSSNGQSTWINGVRFSPTVMINASEGLHFLEGSKLESQYLTTIQNVLGNSMNWLTPHDQLVTNPNCP